MEEIIKKSDMDLTSPIINDAVSPYNPLYPMTLLSDGMKLSFDDAKSAAKEIYNAVTKNASTGTQLSKLHETTRYVVDMSEQTMRDIDKGKIRLSMSKDGTKTYAQMLDENGHFGTKFPIRKEDIITGIDPVQLTMALQMKAMQEQLQDIADQIQFIDHNVKEVLQGQQNDRIAEYYSGVALYLEARNILDVELRKNLVSQALRSLSDSSFKIRLNMQMDMNYLMNGEYKFAKGKRVELIDEKMDSINKGFAIIHQTALLKAGIYCNEKEYGSMATCLDEYSNFISSNITNNAQYLSQFDHSDNGTEQGTWKTRAKLKFDTSSLKQLEQKERVLYLSVSSDKE